MNSKLYYVACGFDAAFAFVGALFHSLDLLLIGGICSYICWHFAEKIRKVEENELTTNNSEKTDK